MTAAGNKSRGNSFISDSVTALLFRQFSTDGIIAKPPSEAIRNRSFVTAVPYDRCGLSRVGRGGGSTWTAQAPSVLNRNAAAQSVKAAVRRACELCRWPKVTKAGRNGLSLRLL